jgi:hypothetical protein
VQLIVFRVVVVVRNVCKVGTRAVATADLANSSCDLFYFRKYSLCCFHVEIYNKYI